MNKEPLLELESEKIWHFIKHNIDIDRVIEPLVNTELVAVATRESISDWINPIGGQK